MLLTRTALANVDGEPNIEWKQGATSLAPGESVVGTLRMLPEEWKSSSGFTVYGAISGNPVSHEIVPATFEWHKPPDPRWTHLTLAVRGSFGGYWVPRGIDVPGARPFQPTTTGGVALRVSKGFSQYLAIEGEFAGGSTGQAEFEPGMTRTGRYGRIVLQGVARYGKDWVGSLRLGTGLQVAMYDSSNADMAGTDIDPLYALGFGIERRLDNFSIGIHGDLVAAVINESQTLVIGLQAGYGWTL